MTAKANRILSDDEIRAVLRREDLEFDRFEHMAEEDLEFDRIHQIAKEAGERGDNSDLLAFLDLIASGAYRPLNRTETASLRQYLAGDFRRKRGYVRARERKAYLTTYAVRLYWKLRDQDPSKSMNETIGDVRAKMRHPPTAKAIKTAVRRSGSRQRTFKLSAS